MLFSFAILGISIYLVSIVLQQEKRFISFSMCVPLLHTLVHTQTNELLIEIFI